MENFKQEHDLLQFANHTTRPVSPVKNFFLKKKTKKGKLEKKKKTLTKRLCSEREGSLKEEGEGGTVRDRERRT